jgi:hypothetical protein
MSRLAHALQMKAVVGGDVRLMSTTSTELRAMHSEGKGGKGPESRDAMPKVATRSSGESIAALKEHQALMRTALEELLEDQQRDVPSR